RLDDLLGRAPAGAVGLGAEEDELVAARPDLGRLARVVDLAVEPARQEPEALALDAVLEPEDQAAVARHAGPAGRRLDLGLDGAQGPGRRHQRREALAPAVDGRLQTLRRRVDGPGSRARGRALLPRGRRRRRVAGARAQAQRAEGRP